MYRMKLIFLSSDFEPRSPKAKQGDFLRNLTLFVGNRTFAHQKSNKYWFEKLKVGNIIV